MNHQEIHLDRLAKMATDRIVKGNNNVWRMDSGLSEMVVNERARKIAEFIASRG